MLHTLAISRVLSLQGQKPHLTTRHILFHPPLFSLPHADLSPCSYCMLHIDKAYYHDILDPSSSQLISTAASVPVSPQLPPQPRQPLHLLIVTPCCARITNCVTYTLCDLHQIYVFFLNGGHCVICKYPVNFIHINEAAFALYWHFYANASNSVCAVPLQVTQATASTARSFPQRSSTMSTACLFRPPKRGSEEVKHRRCQITCQII